jgi:hypothetical protein
MSHSRSENRTQIISCCRALASHRTTESLVSCKSGNTAEALTQPATVRCGDKSAPLFTIDVNVIRGWLGHVSLDTTHRYAELTLRTKQATVAACLPPIGRLETLRTTAGWQKDEELMKWLNPL